MPQFLIQTVALSANALPTLVILACALRSLQLCQAEVFVVSPTDTPVFGRLVSQGEGPADEEFTFSIAEELAREELVTRLEAFDTLDRVSSVVFEELDHMQVRVARRRGHHVTLRSVAGRSTLAYDETRAFVTATAYRGRVDSSEV